MTHNFCRTLSCALALPLAAVAFSAAQMKCPDMPDKITQVNRDVQVEANAGVGTLGKVKAGQLGASIDVVAKNLFEKYPNADRVLVVQMMAATYCPMIRDDKTLKDAEKRRLVTEFQDRVFKFVNPAYNPSPSPQTKPKEKANPTENNQTSTSPSSGNTRQQTFESSMTQQCAQGANCAMSNGQQGGVTAGTYVAGPQLWKLSSKDFDKLTEKFKEMGMPQCVISTATESDSEDLGRQICRAAAGASCITPETISNIAGTAHGLECYANSSTNRDLLEVEGALLSVGLQCEYKGKTFETRGLLLCEGPRTVTVVVGDMPDKTAPGSKAYP